MILNFPILGNDDCDYNFNCCVLAFEELDTLVCCSFHSAAERYEKSRCVFRSDCATLAARAYYFAQDWITRGRIDWLGIQLPVSISGTV